MNYNAFSFWLFFALVYVLYWRFSCRGQNRVMLAASYVFYGFWDYRFLFLILLSTVVDYIGGLGVAGIRMAPRRWWRLALLLIASAFFLCTGIAYDRVWAAVVDGDWLALGTAVPSHMAAFMVPLGVLVALVLYQLFLPRLYALSEQRRKKAFLVISMVANLSILGFFKYYDFFATSLANLLDKVGFPASVETLGIVLPVGISFYTFQAMSYTIDIYRGEARPTDDFMDFALFVCFFPHLVAGPIMRAHTLLPQVTTPRSLPPGAVREGVVLIGIGLFKKVVIADNMALIANAVFFRFADGDGAAVTGAETWVGLYAFALQIYGDFSGYSAIARGISKLFGYELVINFHLPYTAQSPSDFWQRWHISLSTWLRDYLYIPLGGNRLGVARQYQNLLITMLLGGLWHGASWTFVAWGLYHGLLLCVFRILRIPDFVSGQNGSAVLRRLGRIVVMFHLVCLGWLLFRADHFGAAIDMVKTMFGDFTLTSAVAAPVVAMVFLAGVPLALELFFDGERRLQRIGTAPVWVRAALYTYGVAMILLFHAEAAVEFIYFQF